MDVEQKYERPGFLPALHVCSPIWTRTRNPSINSRMLCQLSYRGLFLTILTAEFGLFEFGLFWLNS